MADTDGHANAGEGNTNAPATLPFSSEDQFRTLSRRIEELTREVGKAATPPTIRGIDVVQIIVVVLGFVAAAITGYGLETRISDVRSDVSSVRSDISSTEQRLTAALRDMESRLASKIDKSADQTTRIDERLSRVEGAHGSAPK